MNTRRVAVWIVVGVLLVVAVAGLWLYRHSMDPAKEFEAGDPSLPTRVLIASQGSEYKDALVSDIVDRLKPRSISIKVMDVSRLSGVHENEWTAIIILHTWQAGKPQPDASDFVARAGSSKKVIVVTTSGSGKEKLAGVDAITSASVVSDMQTQSSQIMTRLNALIPH